MVIWFSVSFLLFVNLRCQASTGPPNRSKPTCNASATLRCYGSSYYAPLKEPPISLCRLLRGTGYGRCYRDMKRPSVGSATTASRADYLVCPGCGCGQLQPPPRPFLSRLLECDYCKCAFDKTLVETLKQIVTLPQALGKHSCECGHPEMRRLPDGVFHCPACRAEVLPISIPEPGQIAARRSLAAFEPIPLSAQAHQTI